MSKAKSPPPIPVLSHYFGGKAEFIDWYLGFVPPHHTSVELCAGMAPFTIRKQRAKVEVINDADGLIPAMFSVVRDFPEQLAAVIEATPYSRKEWESCRQVCNDFRANNTQSQWKQLDQQAKIELARAYLVSIRQSGSQKVGMYWSRAINHSRRGVSSSVSRFLKLSDDIVEVADRLREVQVEDLDLIKCINDYDRPETLFFIDPPYLPETRPKSSESYPVEMTREEHEQLIDRLLSIKGKVILCGYASELYDTNLRADRGWRREERKVSCRSAVANSGKVSANGTRREIAWIKH